MRRRTSSFAVSASIPVSAMAYAARNTALITVAEAEYDDPALDSVMREEMRIIVDNARERIKAKDGQMQKQKGVMIHANISSGDEKLQNIFGENLPRLREPKKKYDPGFLFHKWYPIKPE